jgi:hypothetical protein
LHNGWPELAGSLTEPGVPAPLTAPGRRRGAEAVAAGRCADCLRFEVFMGFAL